MPRFEPFLIFSVCLEQGCGASEPPETLAKTWQKRKGKPGWFTMESCWKRHEPSGKQNESRPLSNMRVPYGPQDLPNNSPQVWELLLGLYICSSSFLVTLGIARPKVAVKNSLNAEISDVVRRRQKPVC